MGKHHTNHAQQHDNIELILHKTVFLNVLISFVYRFFYLIFLMKEHKRGLMQHELNLPFLQNQKSIDNHVGILYILNILVQLSHDITSRKNTPILLR